MFMQMMTDELQKEEDKKHGLQGSIIHNIVRLITSLRGHFLEPKNQIAYSDFFSVFVEKC